MGDEPSLREPQALRQDHPPVFVFGSNLAGRHGKGAALWARQHRGAIYGQGEGLQGNSYAIPTKDERLRTLPLAEVKFHVNTFLQIARCQLPDLQFEVTPIGCGLAGYSPEQIAPMFWKAPPNVLLPPELSALLGNRKDGSSQNPSHLTRGEAG